MTSTRNSSDIFKAAHKLDKYLMKGEKTTKQQPSRKPPPTKDADDIEDPLSMPRAGESNSNSDDDVIITNAKRNSNNDAISKFTKFKRKPQGSSSTGNSTAKKPKIEANDFVGDDEVEIEVQKSSKKENKPKTTPTTTPTPRHPKKVSAAAMLDDDDDDVLNFTALAGVFLSISFFLSCFLLPLPL
jgi:hypothetical protein